MTRRPELDALRGLMLVLMTLTHVPTRVSGPLGQPLGFVSAAEGFVVLSAFMAGWVYSDLARRQGNGAMWRAFELRAMKIYLCQSALLIFLFTVVAALGVRTDQPAINNLISFFLDDPWRGLRSGLLLLYNPPLLDILPMYVLFMLLSPPLLALAMRRGWFVVVALSLALWLGAQFGLGQLLYETVGAPARLKVPLNQTGAFEPLAWQFLWVFGLCAGAGGARFVRGQPIPRWLVGAALAVAGSCLVWRRWAGQTPFAEWVELNPLFDKWQLGPLRVLDMLALIVLLLRFGPALQRLRPRWPVLETLGAAALPVFCAHLVMVLLALALFGASTPQRPVWVDVALLTITFATLWGVARLVRPRTSATQPAPRLISAAWRRMASSTHEPLLPSRAGSGLAGPPPAPPLEGHSCRLGRVLVAQASRFPASPLSGDIQN
jgi:hypothetical protein